jgi:hypothetical protein
MSMTVEITGARWCGTGEGGAHQATIGRTSRRRLHVRLVELPDIV